MITATSTNRPNILIIMTDQHRADAMGCAGHPAIQTPHLDRLAARGVRFEHAFTVAPLCMPARASFLSGLYPHNHQMWTNRATPGNELPASDETFFQLLQRAGYYTGHVGKGHYYSWNLVGHLKEREDYTRALGFDYVHETTGPHFAKTIRSYMTDHWEQLGIYEAFKAGYGQGGGSGPGGRRRPWDATANPLSVEEHLDSYIGRIGKEFVEQYDGEQPFALFVGFGGPHEPWDAPGAYATMYDPAHMPDPIPAADPGPWVPEQAALRMRAGRVEGMTAAHARQVRANYYGKITLIDHWIGEILGAVEWRGWGGDTLVIYTSDHGEMAGDHGRLHKVVFYESSVRVPLIVSWPGRTAAGATAYGLAENIDVFPTVLASAGAVPSERALGRSLWPALRDPGARVRDDVLSEVRAGHGPQTTTWMLRTERYKYALDGDSEGYLLHNLQENPQEQVNLIGHPEYRTLEAELREHLLRRVIRCQPVR
ncbi:MAG: sulfatase-like hydrolase/transferase [Chloroflexi bacterium]|nr:sulfatase-like hydrolase/transferase [Chloroflexota bacterium]